MSRDSLTHDVARITANNIVTLFAGCLREEEISDAWIQVYACVKAGFDSYDIDSNRVRQQLEPGRN